MISIDSDTYIRLFLRWHTCPRDLRRNIIKNTVFSILRQMKIPHCYTVNDKDVVLQSRGKYRKAGFVRKEIPILSSPGNASFAWTEEKAMLNCICMQIVPGKFFYHIHSRALKKIIRLLQLRPKGKIAGNLQHGFLT